MEYKGIELEGLEKQVAFRHSRVTERDVNTDWTDTLFSSDMNEVSGQLFHEMSRLSSVINLDYQVCNGGIEQYVFNGYDKETAPYHEQDVWQLDKEEQVTELRRLAAFGECVFPESKREHTALVVIASELHLLDTERDFDEDGVSTGDFDCDSFNRSFWDVSGYLGRLMELYAQYLCRAYGLA